MEQRENMLIPSTENNYFIGTTTSTNTRSHSSRLEELIRRLESSSTRTQIPTTNTYIADQQGLVSNLNPHSRFRQNPYEIQQQQQQAFRPAVAQIPTANTFPLGSVSNLNFHSTFRQNSVYGTQQQQQAFHTTLDFSQNNNNLSIPGIATRSLPQNHGYSMRNRMPQFHIGSSSSSSSSPSRPRARRTSSVLASMSNYNSPSAFGQNTPFIVQQQQQQPSNPTSFPDDTLKIKKLQDEVMERGMKVQHREENINRLKACSHKLEDEIIYCQIAVGGMLAAHRIPDKDGETEDVTINNILKYENSAAALFCRIKYRTARMSDHSIFKDVIGVVAMLGATDDARLSSVLSEYLGLDMLSVVCKTSEGLKALESYNRDGSIDSKSGIHAFADVMGIPLEGRFRAICLDKLRPYTGRFVEKDPHRRLDLMKPVLNGKTPIGFLGFAVNMVFIYKGDMYCLSRAGNTLRETLFYNLFSGLQVYRSREEMFKAQPCISDGAVSLDGGMIQKNGTIGAGPQKRDIDVKFPIRSKGPFYAQDYYETEHIKKWKSCKQRLVLEDLQMEQELLDQAKKAYESKKGEHYNVALSAHLRQRASAPR